MKVRITQYSRMGFVQKVWEADLLEGKMSRVAQSNFLEACEVGSKEEGDMFKLALVDGKVG